jgi:hypothetical protein
LKRGACLKFDFVDQSANLRKSHLYFCLNSRECFPFQRILAHRGEPFPSERQDEMGVARPDRNEQRSGRLIARGEVPSVPT